MGQSPGRTIPNDDGAYDCSYDDGAYDCSYDDGAYDCSYDDGAYDCAYDDSAYDDSAYDCSCHIYDIAARRSTPMDAASPVGNLQSGTTVGLIRIAP